LFIADILKSRNQEMKKILNLLLVVLYMQLFITNANANTDFESTVKQLTTKNLSKKLQTIKQLSKVENDKVKIVFSALLDSKLYYLKSNKNIVLATKKDGKYVVKDLKNNQLGELKKRQIRKISINNKIRSFIKTHLATADLINKDYEIRLTTVKGFYNNMTENLFNIISKLHKTENNNSVKDAMQIAIHIYNIDNKDINIKLNAIKKLDGNLSSAVKNKLLTLQNDNNPQIKQASINSLKTIESKTSVFGFLKTLFFGLSYGSVLILAAMGLAITFGVMRVINMAHGELIMLGAYTTYVVQQLMPNHIAESIIVAIPFAFLVSAIMGIIIQQGVIKHLQGRPLETLLATFGISLILQQLVRSVFSPLNRSVETPQWLSGAWQLNDVFALTYNRIYIIIFCLIVFAVVLLIMQKTRLGLQVRAVSQDRAMASAMGVKSNYVDMMTFGLGSGIAGIAGVALSQLTNVGPNLGQSYIIDSFMVVVFGGVGNLWGTLVAGFSLGITNKFIEPWVGAVLAQVIILVFIIMFIQKKPKGLFPQKGRMAEAG
jgi:urea transport system permease protein